MGKQVHLLVRWRSVQSYDVSAAPIIPGSVFRCLFILGRWGESAGAISVFLQLYANDGNTEGLFRAGIMGSGFAPPTKDITTVQVTYDFVVDQVGCASASDTLACLRTVPVNSLLAAANVAPGGMISFFPREDGNFISMPPMHLPSKGIIADVPFVTGRISFWNPLRLLAEVRFRHR